jgi:hypothetical protein
MVIGVITKCNRTLSPLTYYLSLSINQISSTPLNSTATLPPICVHYFQETFNTFDHHDG